MHAQHAHEHTDWTAAATALGAWHAEPLSAAAAAARLFCARGARQRAYREGGESFGTELTELIARFWLGEDVARSRARLAAQAPTLAQGALVELVYGQLLMSRRLIGARAHLDAGFDRAAPWFAPEDYPTVRRRHARLAALPLGDRPAPPADLATLLREAEVIRILRAANPVPRPRPHDPRDTVG